jgi:hypothetical protein
MERIYDVMRPVWHGDENLTKNTVNDALYAAYEELTMAQREIAELRHAVECLEADISRMGSSLREERRLDNLAAFDR